MLRSILLARRSLVATHSIRGIHGAISKDLLAPYGRYLRESDEQNFDPNTFQRTDIPFDMETGKPSLGDSSNRTTSYEINQVWHDENQDMVVIEWSDGIQSHYSKAWFEQQQEYIFEKHNETHAIDRVLWTNMTESKMRNNDQLCIPFEQLVDNYDSFIGHKALLALYQYGILLVTGTPTHDDGVGVAALASALSGGSVKTKNVSLLAHYHHDDGGVVVLPHGTDGPMRTLYGGVWQTTTSQMEGTSVADSAYGHDALPLHTDMTYCALPPGLQIFTMVQPAAVGGASVFCDGFAAAQTLKQRDAQAYETLATTVRTYRCKDAQTGWYLQALGPIIQTHNNNTITAIRHNDLDRLPDIPSFDNNNNNDLFYSRLEHAHKLWDDILARDETRFVIPLQAGDTMIVANQRCMHARTSFETSPNHPRSIMGCYVSQEELNSRFRMEGFFVP